MLKVYGLGMEEEARGMVSVEIIAEDGHIESFGMSTMDTQLMGATCDGMKTHEGVTILLTYYLIASDGRFAILPIHYLTRTVEIVGREREVNQPLPS